MAKRCAGEKRPYGNVSACSPDTVFAPDAVPKRWNCPWASARKTTTQSDIPDRIAAAAFPTAALPPPPPPPHCMLEKRSSGNPSAAARRDGSRRSLLDGGDPP